MSKTNGKPKTTLAATFDQFRNDYDMSREHRMQRKRTGLAPQGGTADWHYRVSENYYKDIEKARDLDRNDVVISQVVNRAVDNIVQGGFALDAKTGDKKLDADLKARWCEWSEDSDACDIAGECTWHDIEHLAMRSTLVDGDIAAFGLADEGSLQILEAHTIQTNTTQKDTILGVTINNLRRHLKYWIQQDPTTPNDSKEKSVPFDVRDQNGHRQIFHLYRKNRPTQTRGVTAFAPIFATAGMFEDINFAKLVQQQVVSCFAIFRQQALTNGNVGDLPSVPDYGQKETETDAAGTRYIDGVAPGMEIIGKPGQTLEGFSPNVPNAEFFNHVKLMLQLIGVNLGLPLCLVLMDGSETNFSGWRGAVDEARKGFRRNQNNLQKRWHEPIYRWKVRQWMEEDSTLRAAAARSKVNIFGHKWQAPTWQYIDPVKDAQGDAIRLENMLTSPRRLHGEGGRDWDEITTETVEDNAAAIIKAKKKAKAINKAFPDDTPLHWRELSPLPMPSGVDMKMDNPAAAAEVEENIDE